jgi:phosphoenolpyruvate synthase/pyruvate phosphate dikinase
MRASTGILTQRGGMTSHAALVARGWGKCCIVGCDGMHLDTAGKKVRFPGIDRVFTEGDYISLNGSKGIVIARVRIRLFFIMKFLESQFYKYNKSSQMNIPQMNQYYPLFSHLI